MTSGYKQKGITGKGITMAGFLAASISSLSLAQVVKVANPDIPEAQDKAAEETNKTKDDPIPWTAAIDFDKLSHEEIVQHLSHEDFATREEATELVWRRGRPVLNALKKAVSSENPELVSRATRIMRYVKAGILPDTPPHIAKLVQSFADANQDEKEDILRELYAERAFSQMLFMLSELEDKALEIKLYSNFNRLAHHAARESISKGDIEAAIEQLKLAPKSEQSLRSLAYLYAQTGKLDDEINKLNKMSAQLRDKEWEKHLYLEKSDRAEIRKYAKRESMMGIMATLDLLKGDPDQMFQYYSKSAALTAKTGFAIIKAQYDGQSDDFIAKAHAQQKQILELAKDHTNSLLLNQTMKSLSLTGGISLVEPYLEKKYKYESFTYFSSREQPRKALEIIGITDEDSLLKFIKENTRLAVAELELEQEDQREFRGGEQLSYQDRLHTVAHFYYTKGQFKKAKSILIPLLKELHEQENNEWYAVVETIAGFGMADLAVEMVLDRGNDDNTYEQMVTFLFDDTVDTDLIWTTLLKREGGTPEKAFRDLAVIMGVHQSQVKEYHALQAELIKIATRQGIVSLKSMKSALLSVSIYRQDAISAKKYAKQLLDTEENEEAIPLKKLEYLRELSNSLDWKGIITLLDKDASFIQNSPKWLAVYAIAKRKTGDTKSADQLLHLAKLSSIGLSDDLRDIALEHYLAGYYDISTRIVERILIIGSVDRKSRLYSFGMNYLAASNNAYTETKQWGKAAAFFLVNSARDLQQRATGGEYGNVAYYNSDFYNAQFTRGMELYKSGEKAKGLKILKRAHDVLVGDGNLADHFYPAIRTTDLTEQYELWVDESYQYLQKSLKEFPDSSNTHNTAAWILSRAVRNLDEGLKHSEKSLKLTPFEASYIDTMGELYFAKGDRKKAIAWGEKAVMASKYGRLDTLGMRTSAKTRSYSLANQLDRFKSAPLPKAKF